MSVVCKTAGRFALLDSVKRKTILWNKVEKMIKSPIRIITVSIFADLRFTRLRVFFYLLKIIGR